MPLHYVFPMQEICTIFIATEFGEDEMDWLKFGGFVICLSGIILHVIFKTLKGNVPCIIYH